MSVISQSTHLEMEILIGVDQSSDNTLEIVKRLANEYPKVVRCIEHKTRLGNGAKNLQLVLQEAKGDLIAHLDGDDFWLPGKLEAQEQFLIKNATCSAVYTNAAVITGPDNEVGVFTSAQPEQLSLDYLVARGNFLNHSSTFYHSKYKNKILNLEAPFIDYHIHLLFAQEGDLGFINKPFVKYRIDSLGSMRHTENEHVRDLYWQALMSMENSKVSSASFLRGKSEVLRQAFGSAIEERDPAYFYKWWRRVSMTETTRKLSLVFFTLIAVSRRVFISNCTKLKRAGILKGEIIYHIR